MKDFLRQIPKLCAPLKKKMLPQIAGFQSGVLHFRSYLDWFWLRTVERWDRWPCGRPGTRLSALCSPDLGFFGRQPPSPDPQELRGPGALLGIPRNALIPSLEGLGKMTSCLAAQDRRLFSICKKNGKEEEANVLK